MSNSFVKALEQTAQGTFVRDERSRIPVSTRLKEFRERLGLSQKEFAARYDLPLSQVIYQEQPGNPLKSSARVLIAMLERDPEGMREDTYQPSKPE